MVYAMSCSPFSFAVCNRCSKEGAEPVVIFRYFLECVKGDVSKLEKLDEPVMDLKTWKDGGYITFRDWLGQRS